MINAPLPAKRNLPDAPILNNRTRVLLLAVRQALLMLVDAIEVYIGVSRTSEMRRRAKDAE